MLIDTHCHIHEADYPLDPIATIARAHTADVMEMIVVGTSEKSSVDAVDFAARHDGVFAAVGVHPHETDQGYSQIEELLKRELAEVPARGRGRVSDRPNATGEPSAPRRVTREGTSANSRSPLVAIGEIGLDYFYTHSPRNVQIKALEEQLQLALDYDVPVIFHVREAFDDFWPVFDNFPGIRGELHSFTDITATLEQALRRNLYIGVNGISTFAKKDNEQAMFAAIPLQKMLLETDAPFLTPVPFRGKVNEPAFVRNVAEFHAQRRRLSLGEIADHTTANARALFAL